MTRSITSLTLRLSPYHESYNTLNILPSNGQIQGHLTKRQEMCKKHKYCDRFSPILKIEFAPILNNQEQWWGRGGRDEVWDRETMFSQLAKRSPGVVVSG